MLILCNHISGISHEKGSKYVFSRSVLYKLEIGTIVTLKKVRLGSTTLFPKIESYKTNIFFTQILTHYAIET